MNQEIGLSPRECARNSGTFILIRITLGLLVYVALGTIFPIPGEIMLTNIIIIKSNLILVIGLIIAIFFISLFGLFVGFPLQNVTTSIDKNIAKYMRSFRILENLTFIIGISLLILEIPFSILILAFALTPYGLHLILLGYLVYVSGYLNKFLGRALMIGGSIGYLPLSASIILFPSLTSVYLIVAFVAIISEITLALIFIVESKKIPEKDPLETITMILQEMGEATTTEITEAAAKVSAECPDSVPATLGLLEMQNIVTKRFSKEKKGYVWSLTDGAQSP